MKSVFDGYKKLTSSDEFLDWKVTHPGFQLTFAFYADSGKDEKDNFQFGFYDEESKRTIVFYMGPKIEPRDETYESDYKTLPLDFDSVSLDLKEALKLAKDEFMKDTAKATIFKGFYVLQNTNDGQIWSISFLTSKMELWNFRIDAKTGKIVAKNNGKVFDGAF